MFAMGLWRKEKDEPGGWGNANCSHVRFVFFITNVVIVVIKMYPFLLESLLDIDLVPGCLNLSNRQAFLL